MALLILSEQRVGSDRLFFMNLMLYKVGRFSIKSFSILPSRFSIASNLSSICLRTLPMSSAGVTGSGVGGGHLHSSGLSGRLGNGEGGYAAFVFPFSSLTVYPHPSKTLS